MSLFRLGGSGPATPASRPFSRLTVRVPRSMPEVRVVALHAGYGEEVRAGAVVMTLRVGAVRRTVEAPRAGKVLPLAGPGDELVAGDALYALHLERPIDANAAEALSGAAAALQRGKAGPVPARRHVPLMRRDGKGVPAGDPPGDEAAAGGGAEAEQEAGPSAARGIVGGIARLVLALSLFVLGVVMLLPLLIELGVGSSDEARLAVAVA
ncbi:MAG TPA: hypothetical protein VMM55_06110, partial [Thermohalobaculum sp.]|nr:hypothetical protein [Thermohalobaculum sp.]